jgi:hypothetical protein
VIELVFSILAIAITLSGTGWLLKFGWDKGKCAYVVFEQTHAQVSHSSPLPLSDPYSGSVRIEASNDSVTGTADCGQSTEQVTLPELDPETE